MLGDLIEVQKIDPRSIDGGFEYNALRFYDPGYVVSPDKSWWWVQDDAYVIAFGPLPGYTEVGQRPFARWMPARAGSIYALRKFARPLAPPRAGREG